MELKTYYVAFDNIPELSTPANSWRQEEASTSPLIAQTPASDKVDKSFPDTRLLWLGPQHGPREMFKGTNIGGEAAEEVQEVAEENEGEEQEPKR